MATKTISITLDIALVRDIDALIKQSKTKIARSEYLRRLALADLERRRGV